MFTNDKPNREFQPGLDPEAKRRTRQNDRLNLRRADRENRLKAKRVALSTRQRNYDNNNTNNQTSAYRNSNDSVKRNMMLQQLPQFVKGCFTDHPATQFECCQRIRKLLSIERNPPIKEVISSGVVPRLVQFLRGDNYDKLQFEAAWALTNIASGTAEDTAHVIRNGAVPIFVQLLRSRSSEVQEQAVWALGNIAGDSPECRNLVLQHGALQNLLPLCRTNFQTQQQLTLLRNATWTLSNFCRGKPQPKWEHVKLALQALSVMLTSDDDEILQDACWAFSYLSDTDSNDNMHITSIANSGSLAKLIELLQHRSPHVRHPALRTIGNIVTGCDEQTQTVLNLGVLKKLCKLLENDKPPIKREACWTISNITAGCKEQIESVISANIIPPLIEILKNEKHEVKKEALWAISNATSGGSDVQIKFLVNQGVVPPLCDFFNEQYTKKTLLVALEGIENILDVGRREQSFDGVNRFATYVEECNGLDALEALQSNDKIADEIYDKAASIIKTYFNGEEVTQNLQYFDNNNQSNDSNTNNNTNTNNNNNNNTNSTNDDTNINNPSNDGGQFGFGTGNWGNNNNNNGGNGGNGDTTNDNNSNNTNGGNNSQSFNF